MKIIHCADLHLDAAMTSVLGKQQALIRRAELLHTFERMVEYAQREEVCAILIAGDMFDTDRVTATTRNAVLRCIDRYQDIHFYYLKGNHDRDSFLTGLENIPANLFLFGEEWTDYEEQGVRISGMELTKLSGYYAALSYKPQCEKVQLVMLHGQLMEAGAQGVQEGIPLKEFRNKGISYLALGHIHSHRMERLDAGGYWCYAGCLEGRGFDECGEHGFVLLDIDNMTGKVSPSFIPFASRQIYELHVDITDCESSAEMKERILQKTGEAGCKAESLVKVILEGKVDVACEKSEEYLLTELNSRFFCARLEDASLLQIHEADYRFDATLKGEFIRTVMADSSLSEEEKGSIIRFGLQAFTKEGIKI